MFILFYAALAGLAAIFVHKHFEISKGEYQFLAENRRRWDTRLRRLKKYLRNKSRRQWARARNLVRYTLRNAKRRTAENLRWLADYLEK